MLFYGLSDCDNVWMEMLHGWLHMLPCVFASMVDRGGVWTVNAWEEFWIFLKKIS